MILLDVSKDVRSEAGHAIMVPTPNPVLHMACDSPAESDEVVGTELV